MKYSADLNYGDPADSLEIRTISLQTEKGGLTAKGWVKNIKGPNATYSVHLTLNNYEELITGLVEYASALAKVYDEMSNNATPTKIDASLKDDLIKFIKENADEGEKGSKDLVLTFTHENDKYMIGKMEASQVFMALMLLVMPK